MQIRFEDFKDEIDILIEFLTSDTWEFHGTPNPKPEGIRKGYENQLYTGDDCKTFWVISDQDVRVGTIRIYDLQDGDPLFDIRILSNYKGMGVGTTTVKWLVDYIFNNFPDKFETDVRSHTNVPISYIITNFLFNKRVDIRI